MINKGTKESWTINISADELLNFIIFTGCMYDLIDDEDFDKSNTPLTRNLLNSNNKNL